MIYKCTYCQNYFSKPLYLTESDVYYKNDKYTSKHCPFCTDENFEELQVVFDYNGMVFDSKGELLEYLEEQGCSPKEIGRIYKEDVLVLEEWDE